MHHLLFECVVAKLIWRDVYQIFGRKIDNFQDLASCWLCNKKILHLNVVSSTVLWGLWNVRNALIFNRVKWFSIKQVWQKIVHCLGD